MTSNFWVTGTASNYSMPSRDVFNYYSRMPIRHAINNGTEYMVELTVRHSSRSSFTRINQRESRNGDEILLSHCNNYLLVECAGTWNFLTLLETNVLFRIIRIPDIKVANRLPEMPDKMFIGEYNLQKNDLKVVATSLEQCLQIKPNKSNSLY